MRIHFGTKLGKNGYIGTGANPEEGAKGCLYMIFVWPFLLLYYVLIWPFMALVRWISTKAVKNKAVSTNDVTANNRWPWWKWALVVFGGFFVLGLVGVALDGPDKDGNASQPTALPAVVVTLPATEAPLATITPAITPRTTIVPSAQPTPLPTARPATAPTAAYVDADALYMRVLPAKDGEVIGEYTRGQAVEILETEGEWYKVAIGSAVGYMARDYIKKTEALPQSATAEPAEKEASIAATPKPELTPDIEPAHTPEPTQKAGRIIYITPTGKRYHYDGSCNGGKYIESTLDEALNRGLTPCQKCAK